MNAGIAIVNILWEPNMNCLLLEENTIAIFACIGSIYSNKIYNIMDRQDWQSPWWLYGHWLSVGVVPWIFTGSTERNLTFASRGLWHLQIRRYTLWVLGIVSPRVLDSNARHTSWRVRESTLPRGKFCGCTSIITMPTIYVFFKSTKVKHLP